jgi:hypothetical protein
VNTLSTPERSRLFNAFLRFFSIHDDCQERRGFPPEKKIVNGREISSLRVVRGRNAAP